MWLFHMNDQLTGTELLDDNIPPVSPVWMLCHLLGFNALCRDLTLYWFFYSSSYLTCSCLGARRSLSLSWTFKNTITLLQDVYFISICSSQGENYSFFLSFIHLLKFVILSSSLTTVLGDCRWREVIYSSPQVQGNRQKQTAELWGRHMAKKPAQQGLTESGSMSWAGEAFL